MNDDYDKILQLIINDNLNNRLLGFILAKQKNYNIIKLIDKLPVEKINNDNMETYLFKVGSYFLFIAIRGKNTASGIYSDDDKKIINYKRIDKPVESEYFQNIHHGVKMLFIKYIINENYK